MLHRGTGPDRPTRRSGQARRRSRANLRRPWVDRHEPGTPRAAGSAGRLPRRRYPGGDQARPTGPFPARCPGHRRRADRPAGQPEPGRIGVRPDGRRWQVVVQRAGHGRRVRSRPDRLRTRVGMRVAKAKGYLRGKQPKLTHRQEAHLVSLVHGGEYSTAEVAELFNVGSSTRLPGDRTPKPGSPRRPRRRATLNRRPASHMPHPCGTPARGSAPAPGHHHSTFGFRDARTG